MPPQSPFARTLARRAQLLIVAGIVLFVAGIFSIGSLVSWFVTARSNAASAETPSATTPGTFRPTDTQWEGLKIAPVQLLSFRTEHTTEGKIANDDDTTTPVFSPYSGRVIKLYAKAGDSVTQGAPLLALHASEFVQAQNDLIAPSLALSTQHGLSSIWRKPPRNGSTIFMIAKGVRSRTGNKARSTSPTPRAIPDRQRSHSPQYATVYAFSERVMRRLLRSRTRPTG
jgi:hypothetical protein